MNDSEKPKFAQSMAAIGEIYGKDISEVMIGIYWNALKPYPVEDVMRSFQGIHVTPTTGSFSRSQPIFCATLRATKTVKRCWPGQKLTRPFAATGAAIALCSTIRLSMRLLLTWGMD